MAELGDVMLSVIVIVNAPTAVGSSALLGHVRNLIRSAQKQLCVAEIREDTDSSLCRQPCRATPRANANERNADAATRTSIPHPISNVKSAARSAVSFGCPLHGQPDDGLSVKRFVARCRRMIVVAQAGTCHLEAGRVTPRTGGKGNAILLALPSVKATAALR